MNLTRIFAFADSPSLTCRQSWSWSLRLPLGRILLSLQASNLPMNLLIQNMRAAAGSP